MFKARTCSARLKAILLAGALPLFLHACSGGGSSPPPPPPAPPPPPVNAAPNFTSPPQAGVVENQQLAYTAAATDPEGAAVTYALAGGADQALFQITANGQLTFKATPNFERPRDANGDNVYQVTVSASDGQTSSVLALSITVQNGGADGLRVTRIATGLQQPFLVTGASQFGNCRTGGSGQYVFIAQRSGRVTTWDVNARTADPNGGLTAVPGRLLGFAPEEDEEGFYFFYVNAAGEAVVEGHPPFTGTRSISRSTRAVRYFRIPAPPGGHVAGTIAHRNNFLYIATGDESGNAAQAADSLLGKILRITTGTNQGPAELNVQPDVIARGLHRPNGLTLHPQGGYFFADRGTNAFEEINIFDPTATGANYGWPFMEGTSVRQQPIPGGLIPPAAQYAHGTGPGQGSAVVGGEYYRGTIEALQGEYFFADAATGKIWSIAASQASIGATLDSSAFLDWTTAFTPVDGTLNQISGFGTDCVGNLFITDDDGDVFKVEAT